MSFGTTLIYKISPETLESLLTKYGGYYGPSKIYNTQPQRKRAGLAAGGISLLLINLFGKFLFTANYPKWFMGAFAVISVLFTIVYFILYNKERCKIDKFEFSEIKIARITPSDWNMANMTIVFWLFSLLVATFAMIEVFMSGNIFLYLAAMLFTFFTFGNSGSVVATTSINITILE